MSYVVLCSCDESYSPTKPSCQIRVNVCQTLSKPPDVAHQSCRRAVVTFQARQGSSEGHGKTPSLTPPVSVSRISSASCELRSVVSSETVWSTCYFGSDGSALPDEVVPVVSEEREPAIARGQEARSGSPAQDLLRPRRRAWTFLLLRGRAPGLGPRKGGACRGGDPRA
jgi:hypothetical protein